jgi:Na+-translocating ferredoxin:NAD+ oxidoreductase RnfD subunit
MDAIGIGLVILGFVMAAVSNLWILIIAFRRHIGWGIACLLLPIAQFVFVIMNLQRTLIPFVIGLVSAGFMVGGFFLSPTLQKSAATNGTISGDK